MMTTQKHIDDVLPPFTEYLASLHPNARAEVLQALLNNFCPECGEDIGSGSDCRCDGEIAADQTLANIARKVMAIPTLETQNADDLDFHEVAVWKLREMLRMAYHAGRASR